MIFNEIRYPLIYISYEYTYPMKYVMLYYVNI